MEKLFKSTRGNQTPIDFYTSILQGIASDGGLLVPDFDFEKKNREFDSCLQFFTNQIAQNVDYINAFEFFCCQISENNCTNMG